MPSLAISLPFHRTIPLSVAIHKPAATGSRQLIFRSGSPVVNDVGCPFRRRTSHASRASLHRESRQERLRGTPASIPAPRVFQVCLTQGEQTVPAGGENEFAISPSGGHGDTGSRLLQVQRGLEEVTGAVPEQRGPAETDPQIAGVVRRDAQGLTERLLQRKSRGPPALDQLKGEPVEANEARFRANPQVAVGGLSDGVDRAAGKTFVRSPMVANILGHSAVGIDGGGEGREA